MFKRKNKDKSNLSLLETDLLRDEIEISFNYQKDLRMGLILLILAIIIIVESFIFLLLWEKKIKAKSLAYLESEITEIKNERRDLESQYLEAANFKKQLALVDNVFSRHVYWSQFFKFLEDNTLKTNLYYQSFSGDLSGQAFILPSRSNNVLALGYQSKHFSALPLLFSSVIENEKISSDEGQTTQIIDFDLKLKIDPQIFN